MSYTKFILVLIVSMNSYGAAEEPVINYDFLPPPNASWANDYDDSWVCNEGYVDY